MGSVERMFPQTELDDDVELLAPEEEMVPEHDLHRVLVDLIAAGLRARFADEPDVAVVARLAWFPDRADTRYRRRLARARRYGVEEVVIVNPFAAGGVGVEHLRADGERFRSVASSASRDRLVVIDSLGIRMAGGDKLAVIEDGRRWPTTDEAFRVVNTLARRADEEAARAERERQRQGG